jgi:CRP-like cAMP-binding protein
MKQANADLLKRIWIFESLASNDLSEVASKCQWNHCQKGQVLIEASESSTDVFYVVEGAVAAKAYSLDGKEVTFAHIRTGEMFGEFSALDGQTRSATIYALEEACIARMQAGMFRTVMEKHSVVAIRVAEHLVKKLRFLTRRIFEFSTLPVKYRVQAELLRYCDAVAVNHNTARIEPAPTHHEIATRISTHREAVSRELSLLEADGIISASRQKIVVLDVDRLRSSLSPLVSE